MGKLTISMAILNSHVRLPEGKSGYHQPLVMTLNKWPVSRAILTSPEGNYHHQAVLINHDESDH